MYNTIGQELIVQMSQAALRSDTSVDLYSSNNLGVGKYMNMHCEFTACRQHAKSLIVVEVIENTQQHGPSSSSSHQCITPPHITTHL